MTEKETSAYDELVRLASENGMYFVAWFSHGGFRFAGIKNCSGKKANVYAAMYEMFYDITASDKVLFMFDCEKRESDIRATAWFIPWDNVLRETKVRILQCVVKGAIS